MEDLRFVETRAEKDIFRKCHFLKVSESHWKARSESLGSSQQNK